MLYNAVSYIDRKVWPYYLLLPPPTIVGSSIVLGDNPPIVCRFTCELFPVTVRSRLVLINVWVNFVVIDEVVMITADISGVFAIPMNVVIIAIPVWLVEPGGIPVWLVEIGWMLVFSAVVLVNKQLGLLAVVQIQFVLGLIKPGRHSLAPVIGLHV